MKNSKITFCLITLFTIFLSNLEAIAQIGNPGIMYQGAFNNAMFLTTKSSIERGMKGNTNNKVIGKKEPHTKNLAVNLNFTSSTKIQDKVLNMVASMAANGNRDKIKTTTEVIKNANFLGEFNKLLKPYGFSSHNLADVFTAFIALSWQAVNNGDVAKYPQGIQNLRKQMNDVMSNNPAVSAFNNDQKQEIAEILSYMAIIFTYARQEQLKTNNSANWATTRENIRQGAIKVSGIDLQKYTFNNDGLIEK